MNRLGCLGVGLTISIGLLAGATFAWAQPFAQAENQVRRPRGIYAVVNIDGYIDTHGGLTEAAIRADLDSLYTTMLDNQAVSGLAIQMGWYRLNQNPPTDAKPYQWTYLDDAFAAVDAWNDQNLSLAPKTIQISIFPGLFTPKWLLDLIPTCDGLFDLSLPPATTACGTVTFKGFFEPHEADVLPLPWNPVYKDAYKTFIEAFADRFGKKPALVSMDVGGPTTASTEMIVPRTGNTPKQFGGTIEPDKMWRDLQNLFYPGQPATDQPFVDAWDAAIDMFGKTFSGLTLVVYSGDGLPNFSNTFTIPPAFKDDCPFPSMDCAAEATILSHFVDPAAGGNNTKATGEEGLNGFFSTTPGNLGPSTAKRLSESTAQLSSPSAQVLGGHQFGTGFSTGGIAFGCSKAFPPGPIDKPAACVMPPDGTKAGDYPVTCIPQACLNPFITATDLVSFGYATLGDVEKNAPLFLESPEQALFNILRNYFKGTAAASLFAVTPGTAPENYLQIYAADFFYATKHATEPGLVVIPGGAAPIPILIVAQDLLNTASQQILAMAERPPVIGSVKNAFGTFYIGPNFEATITGTDLAPVGFDSSNGKGPTSLRGVSVTVNGKSAAISRISPTEVRIIVPSDIPATGSVPLQLTTNGSTSTAVMVECATKPILPGHSARTEETKSVE